jgi:hypothetical protein
MSCSAFLLMRRAGVFFGAGLCARTFISFVAASSEGLRLALGAGSVLRLREALSRASRLTGSSPIFRARSVVAFVGGIFSSSTGGELTLAEPFVAGKVGDKARAGATVAATAAISRAGIGIGTEAADGIVGIGAAATATGRGASVAVRLGAITCLGASVASTLGAIAERKGAAAAAAAARADITALDAPDG